MEKLQTILQELERGVISADHAESEVLRLFNVSNNEALRVALPKDENYCEWCKGECRRKGTIYDEED